MPTYEYKCESCHNVVEIFHSMSDESEYECTKCNMTLKKMISGGYFATSYHVKPTMAGHKENEHRKKVKDPERAVKMRKKAFGKDAVGDPSMQNDPKHIIKGRTLGGQEMDIDKKEFIKAAAKDDLMVHKGIEALKKSERKKK